MQKKRRGKKPRKRPRKGDDYLIYGSKLHSLLTLKNTSMWLKTTRFNSGMTRISWIRVNSPCHLEIMVTYTSWFNNTSQFHMLPTTYPILHVLSILVKYKAERRHKKNERKLVTLLLQNIVLNTRWDVSMDILLYRFKLLRIIRSIRQ